MDSPKPKRDVAAQILNVGVMKGRKQVTVISLRLGKLRKAKAIGRGRLTARTSTLATRRTSTWSLSTGLERGGLPDLARRGAKPRRGIGPVRRELPHVTKSPSACPCPVFRP